MAKDANWRFHPFDETFNYQPITDEPQTVYFMEEIGIFGFVLDEFPRIESGGNSLQVFEDIGGSPQWIEIDSSGDPAAGEYRLDRLHDTAIVEFNPADDGRRFLITYTGQGSVINLKKIKEQIARGLFVVNGLPVSGFLDDGRPFFRRTVSGSIGHTQPWNPLPHGLNSSIFYGYENGYIGSTQQVGISGLSDLVLEGELYLTGFVVRPGDAYILRASDKRTGTVSQQITLDYLL